MKLSLKEKLSGLLIAIFFYGAIMSIILILYAFKFRLNGWLMYTIVLAGYVWADTTLLNNELTSIIGIFVAKGINILFLILYFMIRFHSYAWNEGVKSKLVTLLISAVIILIYWAVNKYEDKKNMVMAMIMFSFAVLLYGYVGLRGDYNNYIRDDIYDLAIEVDKVEEMLESDVDFKEISSALSSINYDDFGRIERYYINGNIDSFYRYVINTPMTIAYYKELGWENRAFLKIICSRFRSNLLSLYDYGKGEFTPRKLRKFFEHQQRYALAYPEGVKPGVHSLIYEWSRKKDDVSRELMLFSLGDVDFTKLQEIEKIRGKLDLSYYIINFDKYDRTVMWNVFIAYKNSTGEHKQEIFNGLQSLYFKGEYRQIMIDIAQDDEELKELVDMFEAIYRD